MARRSGREVSKQLAARMKRRLAAGWTADKVRALATDVILERLAGFGIITSADEFVEQARAEHAASVVGRVPDHDHHADRSVRVAITSSAMDSAQ